MALQLICDPTTIISPTIGWGEKLGYKEKVSFLPELLRVSVREGSLSFNFNYYHRRTSSPISSYISKNLTDSKDRVLFLVFNDVPICSSSNQENHQGNHHGNAWDSKPKTPVKVVLDHNAVVGPEIKPRYHQLKNELFDLLFLESCPSNWSAPKARTRGLWPPRANATKYSEKKKKKSIS
ncbi:hypothetical protein Vadar_028500 [Vaccinium darrowii]|uniref:Uncharacterized protein n=1 Tax=Vaccinium darrowii TaxID=229202 RepID=A0ACB7XKX1_9ERIC|nr:hypothetical protein Vadar_028500 [Vaccinium darrowii]